MFKFQKFHFRTEKFAKSGFIHHRIVVTLLNSNTRLGSMIVISNVRRSQLKFFRPKGHVEDPLQLTIHFITYYPVNYQEFSESLRVKN